MNSSILQHISYKYHGKVVQGRVFFRANGYAATAISSSSQLTVSIELPDISRKPSHLTTIVSSIAFPCEYNAPSLTFSLQTDTDDFNNDIAIDTINNITELLKQNEIKPNTCIKCMEPTDEYYNVNGYFCPIHKDCANELLRNKKENCVSPADKKIKGLLVAAAFALFGSLSFIIFASLGIMPALGGIIIGILSAIGYKFFNNKITRKEKLILFLLFVIFCAGSNTLADFIYATSNGQQLDFIMTYSDIRNLFGTIFDILAGAIIAVSSMSIIMDIDLKANSCDIRKIPVDKNEEAEK